MIKGFFRNGAGYVNAHLVADHLRIDETIEFLVDTGASSTVLLDRDIMYLGLDYKDLELSKQDVIGIGGCVETYILKEVIMMFIDKEKTLILPIFALKHPLESMELNERTRILSFPSLLGRDVINRFKLIFDKEDNEISLLKRLIEWLHY